MLRSFEGSGGSSSELLLAPFAFPHPEKKKADLTLESLQFCQNYCAIIYYKPSDLVK